MCVFRATGDLFRPSEFLASSAFDPIVVFSKGDPVLRRQGAGPRRETSGFHLSVSDGSWSELTQQAGEAEEFLRQNRNELVRLSRFPGVTNLVLNFPLEKGAGREEATVELRGLPESLSRLASELDISLEISVYPVSEGPDADGEAPAPTG